MRKKLFAILMSAMMMVTFMPAMAFAAQPDTVNHTDGHTYDLNLSTTEQGYLATTDWKDVVAAAQSHPDTVQILATPTETSEGSVKLVCTGTVGSYADLKCDYSITVKFPKLKTTHTCSFATTVEMTVDEYFAKLLAQGENEDKVAAAKKNFDAYVCTVTTKKCTCGKIEGTLTDGYTVSKRHAVASAVEKCDETYVCTNPGCGKTVKRTRNNSGVEGYQYCKDHANGGKAPLKTKTCCDGTVVNTYKCTVCGDNYVDTAESATGCKAFKTAVTKTTVDGTFLSEAIEVWKDDLYSLKTAKVKAGYIAVVESGSRNGEIVTDKVWSNETCRFYKADTEYVNPTTGKAYYAYTCVTCDSVYNSGVEKNPATCAHTFALVQKDPTATVDGYWYYKCSKCGAFSADGTAETNLDAAIAAHPITHPTATVAYEVVETVQSTCIDEGYYKLVDKNNAANVCFIYASDFGTNTALYVNPTVADPKNTKTATYTYGWLKLDKIAANAGHKYTKKTTLVAANCCHPELIGYTCDVCGKKDIHHVETVAGTQLDHKWNKVHHDATCGAYGYYTEQCSECKNFKTTAGYAATETAAGVVKTRILEETPVVKLDTACNHIALVPLKAATIFEEGTLTDGCSVCGAVLGTKAIQTVAKLSYAAPKVSVKKGKVVVTVAAQADAVKYVVKAGKKTKTVTAAGKVTLKKVAKKGKKVKVTVTAYNAAGAKVVSKAKTVKAK